MKKLLFLCLSIILSTSSMLAQTTDDEHENSADSCLVVWHKDGAKVMFKLEETPKITYVNDSVVIQSSTVVQYAFQDIRKISFEKFVPSSIPETRIQNNIPFRSDGQHITFLPANRDIHVRVITLNGTVVKEFVVRKHEPISFTLRSYPAKLYLMNVDGVTYKICVR
ncbi:MAG: hypothetical protein K6A67_09730 [Bacteroidales bacterium]|nr:hypothetical protein [Bacteroidales bacterium]